MLLVLMIDMKKNDCCHPEAAARDLPGDAAANALQKVW